MKKLNFNKNKFGINILTMSLTISGIISLSSGAVLNKMDIKPNTKMVVKVIEKHVAKKKSNTPTLNEITVEINQPISVNITDYISNLDDIDEIVLSRFKLDTSLVNVTQAGTYNYTISYKDKKYNGIVNVKEKELPVINNMTLKEISLELGSSLPKNLNDFIVESIPEEAKDSIVIDLSKVNVNMAGTYLYKITYNNNIFTGNITIYESQPQIITPTTPSPSEEKKEEVEATDKKEEEGQKESTQQ